MLLERGAEHAPAVKYEMFLHRLWAIGEEGRSSIQKVTASPIVKSEPYGNIKWDCASFWTKVWISTECFRSSSSIDFTGRFRPATR